MSNSTVVVGAASDTAGSYTVTITRDAADTDTDWTTATAVVLVLPDGSTKPVSKTSATASQWVGTVRYIAWFAAANPYKEVQTTYARATFPVGQLTLPDDLNFSIRRT
jgi:hypothetical protein